MDTELARKLLGVDGSNLLMLETAWHHRRTQILEQQVQSDSEAEIAEQDALLANLDLARAVLKDAAKTMSREPTYANGPAFPLNIHTTWLNVIIGVAVGTVAAAAIIAFIAWLAGHPGS